MHSDQISSVASEIRVSRSIYPALMLRGFSITICPSLFFMEELSSVWAFPGGIAAFLSHYGSWKGNDHGGKVQYPVNKGVPDAPVGAAKYLPVIAAIDGEADDKLQEAYSHQSAAKIMKKTI